MAANLFVFKQQKLKSTQHCKFTLTWRSAYLERVFTWIPWAMLFGSSLLWADDLILFSRIRLRPWSVVVITFLLAEAGLGHNWAVQVQFTAQGGVELLATPQLLLQSAVLHLQALQSADTGHNFLLNSSYGRDSRFPPITGLLLA